jgi:uncharacterized cupin superfamily protein
VSFPWSGGICHWDDVDSVRREKGPMAATWQRLGDAAGAKGIGVNRIRIDSGRLSTPPHSHNRAEEIFFVLAGAGLSWQDGRVCEVRAGDTIVHLADHEEHTLRAGPDGLDVLAFGTRHPSEYGWLPRARAMRFGYVWTEGRTDDPWDVEAEVGELEFAEPGDRPPNVVALEDVELDEDGDKVVADAAGSQKSGMKWSIREPNAELAIPHCHSAEEEAFVVLEGDGTLELWPSPVPAARGVKGETHPIRAGHVVARPPGTRVSHFIKAGQNGMTCLVYGTRDPNDIVYYPRSNKIAWRGVGVLGRIETLDYWDGEPRS